MGQLRRAVYCNWLSEREALTRGKQMRFEARGNCWGDASGAELYEMVRRCAH